MQLTELKNPFELLRPEGDFELNEIADRFLTEEDSYERDKLFSILVCDSWVALETIFYQKGNSNLSEEECYDIYLDAIHYVLGKRIWKSESSKLYNDPDAFIKAVRVSTKHLKLNYIESQFKHKRVANTYAISIDQLEEDFQDGFFTDKVFIDRQDLIEKRAQKIVRYFFKKKKYLDAYILDNILFNDVYATVNYETSFSYKKMRKCIRHLDCKRFAEEYKVSEDEVRYSLKYFKDYTNIELDAKVKKCLTSWQKEPTIIKTFT